MSSLISLARHNPRALVVVGALALIAVVAFLVMSSGSNDSRLGGEPVNRTATEPIVIAPGEPIVLGISAPVTGPDSLLGREDADGAVTAVKRWKDVNGQTILGHEIVVRIEDDGCTEADIAAQAAGNLVTRRGVVGVIGPNCSDGALSALGIYARAGIVTVSGSATLSDLAETQPDGGFFFRTAYRNDLQAALIGLFITFDLGADRAYVVDDGGPYGLDLAHTAAGYMERSDVLVSRTSIERGSVDFSDVVDHVMTVDPQIVIFAGFNPEASLLYRQLRDAGYEGLFGSGDGAASQEAFVEPVGEPIAEGVLFAGCSMNLPGDFTQDFRRMHGYEPSASPFVAQYADAATILLNAISRVAVPQDDGSLLIDPIELRDALRSQVLQEGISGAIAFDENGDRVSPDTRTLPDLVDEALLTQDLTEFVNLGLVPCQVQDGRLVNLLGPGAVPIRLP